MVIRFGSGVLRNQSEQARASPVLAPAKHDQGRRLLCCLLLFELRTRRAMRRPCRTQLHSASAAALELVGLPREPLSLVLYQLPLADDTANTVEITPPGSSHRGV